MDESGIRDRSIWLVVADNGGHNAGWPVRAFSSRAAADAWARAEQSRVRNGSPRPAEWVDGTSLSVEEVPFGVSTTRPGLPVG